MSNPNERLKYHVTGAIERGEKEAIVEQRPYFCEGSEAMVALEAMVDRVGMANVLYALAHISREKAEHLRTNWQDRSTSQWWDMRAGKLDAIAAKPFMHDA